MESPVKSPPPKYHLDSKRIKRRRRSSGSPKRILPRLPPDPSRASMMKTAELSSLKSRLKPRRTSQSYAQARLNSGMSRFAGRTRVTASMSRQQKSSRRGSAASGGSSPKGSRSQSNKLFLGADLNTSRETTKRKRKSQDQLQNMNTIVNIETLHNAISSSSDGTSLEGKKEKKKRKKLEDFESNKGKSLKSDRPSKSPNMKSQQIQIIKNLKERNKMIEIQFKKMEGALYHFEQANKHDNQSALFHDEEYLRTNKRDRSVSKEIKDKTKKLNQLLKKRKRLHSLLESQKYQTHMDYDDQSAGHPVLELQNRIIEAEQENKGLKTILDGYKQAEKGREVEKSKIKDSLVGQLALKCRKLQKQVNKRKDKYKGVLKKYKRTHEEASKIHFQFVEQKRQLTQNKALVKEFDQLAKLTKEIEDISQKKKEFQLILKYEKIRERSQTLSAQLQTPQKRLEDLKVEKLEETNERLETSLLSNQKRNQIDISQRMNFVDRLDERIYDYEVIQIPNITRMAHKLNAEHINLEMKWREIKMQLKIKDMLEKQEAERNQRLVRAALMKAENEFKMNIVGIHAEKNRTPSMVITSPNEASRFAINLFAAKNNANGGAGEPSTQEASAAPSEAKEEAKAPSSQRNSIVLKAPSPPVKKRGINANSSLKNSIEYPKQPRLKEQNILNINLKTNERGKKAIKKKLSEEVSEDAHSTTFLTTVPPVAQQATSIKKLAMDVGTRKKQVQIELGLEKNTSLNIPTKESIKPMARFVNNGPGEEKKRTSINLELPIPMNNRVPVAMVQIPEIYPTPFPGQGLNFESSELYQVSTPLLNRYRQDQEGRSMTGLRQNELQRLLKLKESDKKREQALEMKRAQAQSALILKKIQSNNVMSARGVSVDAGSALQNSDLAHLNLEKGGQSTRHLPSKALGQSYTLLLSEQKVKTRSRFKTLHSSQSPSSPERGGQPYGATGPAGAFSSFRGDSYMQQEIAKITERHQRELNDFISSMEKQRRREKLKSSSVSHIVSQTTRKIDSLPPLRDRSIAEESEKDLIKKTASAKVLNFLEEYPPKKLSNSQKKQIKIRSSEISKQADSLQKRQERIHQRALKERQARLRNSGSNSYYETPPQQQTSKVHRHRLDLRKKSSFAHQLSEDEPEDDPKRKLMEAKTQKDTILQEVTMDSPVAGGESQGVSAPFQSSIQEERQQPTEAGDGSANGMLYSTDAFKLKQENTIKVISEEEQKEFIIPQLSREMTEAISALNPPKAKPRNFDKYHFSFDQKGEDSPLPQGHPQRLVSVEQCQSPAEQRVDHDVVFFQNTEPENPLTRTPNLAHIDTGAKKQQVEKADQTDQADMPLQNRSNSKKPSPMKSYTQRMKKQSKLPIETHTSLSTLNRVMDKIVVGDGSCESYDEEADDRPAPNGNFSEKTVPIQKSKKGKKKKKKAKGIRQMPTQVEIDKKRITDPSFKRWPDPIESPKFQDIQNHLEFDDDPFEESQTASAEDYDEEMIEDEIQQLSEREAELRKLRLEAMDAIHQQMGIHLAEGDGSKDFDPNAYDKSNTAKSKDANEDLDKEGDYRYQTTADVQLQEMILSQNFGRIMNRNLPAQLNEDPQALDSKDDFADYSYPTPEKDSSAARQQRPSPNEKQPFVMTESPKQ